MNAETKIKAAAIDWHAPVCTNHDMPLVGRVMDDRADGMKRVALPSLSRPSEQIETVWIYDGRGRRPSEDDPQFNLINFDRADNVRRIEISKR